MVQRHSAPPEIIGSEPTLGAVSAEAATPARRGNRLYFVASMIAQASALVRYVAIARLLGPEQLGLAAALTVTAGFFDMISDTGSDRFLIQDRLGGSVAVQKLVQLADVLRGFIVAATLVVCSIPIAHVYDSPALTNGLVFLAIAPAVLGFVHADIRRNQRDHNFRSEAICILSAEVVGLLVALLAAWITRDYKAVAWGLIARASVRVLASHLQSTRPYRLGWDRDHARRLARFAAPLMVNGFLLFIVSQGDRVIVGSHLGVTSLGYYSSAVLLVYYPSSIVSVYLHTVYVPVIAALRDAPSEQRFVSDRLGSQIMGLALLMAVGFSVVGPPVLPLLFGNRFAQPAMLIGLIGTMQAARFLLTWPTTMALALGRTTTVLMSNVAHLLIFPGAYLGLQCIGGLTGIVTGFIVAELIANAVALVLLNRAMHCDISHGFWRLGALTATGVCITGWVAALQSNTWSADVAIFALTAALLAVLWHREASLRNEIASMARSAWRASALDTGPV